MRRDRRRASARLAGRRGSRRAARTSAPMVPLAVRRSLLLAATLALTFLVVFAVPALADHEPSSSVDLFQGIGFDAGEEGGPLTRAYPPAHYKLDINVGDPGVLDVERNLEKLLHLAAAAIWNLTSLLMMGLISVFMWAFSLDLLERGLGGVGQASELLYRDALGREWMVVAILLAGLWGIWKALVQRRYAESAGAIAVSVCFAVLALFLVYQPVRTITQASAYGDKMSNAFLSVASVGPEAPGGVGPRQPGAPATTKALLSDRLFKAFVYDPWVVLNFGGLNHCVDARNQPAGSALPAGGGREGVRCIDHRTAYASNWLRYAPYSDERKAEYEALNRGEAPEPPGKVDGLAKGADAVVGALVPGGLFSSDREDVRAAPGQFAGRSISGADEPAVDMQQEGAGLDRLALASLVFVGDLGAVVLLGALSLGIVLAQVVALLLVAFAPVALIAGIFPGKGHDFFRLWIKKLVEAVLRKAVYSLLIAVILAVLSTLFVATSALPWGVAFAFQSAFLWALFLGRKQLAGKVASAGPGPMSRAAQMARAPAGRAGTLGLGAAGVVGGGIGYGTRRAGQWNTRRREGSAQAALMAGGEGASDSAEAGGGSRARASAALLAGGGERAGAGATGARAGGSSTRAGAGAAAASSGVRERRFEPGQASSALRPDDVPDRLGEQAGRSSNGAGPGAPEGSASAAGDGSRTARASSSDAGSENGAAARGTSADRASGQSAPASGSTRFSPERSPAADSPAALAAHAERRIGAHTSVVPEPLAEPPRRRRGPFSGLRGRS